MISLYVLFLSIFIRVIFFSFPKNLNGGAKTDRYADTSEKLDQNIRGDYGTVLSRPQGEQSDVVFPEKDSHSPAAEESSLVQNGDERVSERNKSFATKLADVFLRFKL